MIGKYNKYIAFHYSAYRPPLHKLILEKCLNDDEYFNLGLDIGCGTGYSSIALSKYCSTVLGLEPNNSMLKGLQISNKIIYINGFANRLPIKDESINIITFAGSLYYAKSKELILELERISSKGTIILVYDFYIMLDSYLKSLNMPEEKSLLNYDHKINLSNDSSRRLLELEVQSEIVILKMSSDELAHIILSNQHLYPSIEKRYGYSNHFSLLAKDLSKLNKTHSVKSMVYYSKYELIK